MIIDLWFMFWTNPLLQIFCDLILEGTSKIVWNFRHSFNNKKKHFIGTNEDDLKTVIDQKRLPDKKVKIKEHEAVQIKVPLTNRWSP